MPFTVWCNLTLHDAIGSSAAIGFPIAVADTLGYIYNELGIPGLPEFSVGYTYLPALAGIVAASVLTAPLGWVWPIPCPWANLSVFSPVPSIGNPGERGEIFCKGR